MIKLFIVGLVLVVVGLVALKVVEGGKPGGDNPSEISSGSGKGTNPDGSKEVTIEGEVNHPGAFSVMPNDTLATLVQKAGGYTADADTYAIVEDTPVGDFNEFYIPTKADDFCEPKAGVKINVNDKSVTSEAMNKVFDIGNSYCQGIIDHREKNGPFVLINQLMDVKNIGEARFDKIKDKVTLK